MLLVLHKMTFHENDAAYICVTMRKRASGIRAIICHIKFWHRYDIAENRFFWQELQEPITWKRGPPPPRYLYESDPHSMGCHVTRVKCPSNVSSLERLSGSEIRLVEISYMFPHHFPIRFLMFHLVFPQFLWVFPMFPLVFLPVSYFRSYNKKTLFHKFCSTSLAKYRSSRSQIFFKIASK